MNGDGNQRFSDEEAETILREAARLDRHDSVNYFTRDRLVETAAELGIRPEAVIEAEKNVLAQRETDLLRTEFALESKSEMRQQWSKWLGLSVMLFGINMATNGFKFDSGLWFIYPVGIVGAVTAAAWFRYITNPPTKDESQFQEWLKDRQMNKSI